ncbi:MAG: 16S rRNA (cytidine(1402)-2'-O)-methyltransferase [Deltaproteobacteria bacterium]|jgi:16S rRNA (cytidine1402-2'-O)-methyltransferase|nr:16S rRNA (cytidine(1402)-2'-O)-methyltransferase [Deltaproteobacteria bacterium]
MDHLESKRELTPGLYLLPGPLGNLGDLSQRAIEVLTGADLVAAEDTRRTVKLLNYLGLKKPMISYREQNHHRSWPGIDRVLAGGGRVALLSDAGAPTISDPGAGLVAAAVDTGYAVFPIPGPSAIICALMASGFISSSFTFAGFLPSTGPKRRTRLEELKNRPESLVFFESPHRLADCLADMADILGPRSALMAREMTKIHEEYLHLDLPALAENVRLKPRRGEVTLVVSPPDAAESRPASTDDLAAIEAFILQDDRPTKILATALSEAYGRPRKEIYALVLAVRNRQKD